MSGSSDLNFLGLLAWLRSRAWGLALGVICWLGAGALAPVVGQVDSLAGIAGALSRYGQRVPTEKLFLHLDRPGYTSGETMWFKVYAVEGRTHQPLAASAVAYVEVLDDDNQAVVQVKIALHHATGQGSVVLPAGLASGRYTVRAYTSWMQNFAPELYFHTLVTVVNTRTPLVVPAAHLARPYDLQFFPEGGYLVQGLRSKVGFKITDGSGQSVAAEGDVLDQNGSSVLHFTTLRFGLGSFSFTPAKAGGTYTAVVRLANQQLVKYSLPAARAQGYVLTLEEASPGQLRIAVQTQGVELTEKLFLLGHTQQRVAVAADAQLRDGQAVFVVNKDQLAAGISHFTLFNSRRQPLCERLYFRPPPAPLALTARADKSQYEPRQKVSLQLAALNPAGQSLPANLSVAVYQLDSLSAAGGPDMASYLWLTSDVKGVVENPAYYCTASGSEAAEAADNLMLTQGWSRFRWADVLAAKPDSLVYLPELNGSVVRGRVVNSVTKVPLANIPIYLTAPSRHLQLYSAASRQDGSFLIELPDLYGSRQLVVQANPTRDSLCQIEVLSPFARQYAVLSKSPFTLNGALAASLQRRHVQAEVQRRYFGAVPVRYQLPLLRDSLPFYGKPSERYLLDDYTRFKVMEEVMREYVPGVLVRARKDGFHFLVPDNNAHTIIENPLVLLDGMPVFNTNKIMAFDPLKVRRLDVITTRYFLGPSIYNGVVSYSTYGGDLAGFPLDSHALLLEYEGLQGQRDFYAPRYETTQQQQNRLPDFRNLLYWNPQVLTDSSLPLTFYTSDQVGRYRVVVQGLSTKGLAGSTSFTFTVSMPPRRP